MYEVNTAIKTLLVTEDKAKALALAEETAKTSCYVEVLHVTTVTPWYAETVKIFMR